MANAVHGGTRSIDFQVPIPLTRTPLRWTTMSRAGALAEGLAHGVPLGDVCVWGSVVRVVVEECC